MEKIPSVLQHGGETGELSKGLMAKTVKRVQYLYAAVTDERE